MLARIERAAIEVIAGYGRDAFTTTQIARRAGCSVGAVYRLFSDRLAILDWLYPNRSQALGSLRSGVGEGRELVLVPASSPTITARRMDGASGQSASVPDDAA